MDLIRQARSDSGMVPSAALGDHPARAACRRGLELCQPRVYVASTQPVGAAEQVAAVRLSVTEEYAFLGQTALWLYGAGSAPAEVCVGVPHGTRYRVRPPTEVSRVCEEVLRGSRTINGCRVVALEIAVIQACSGLAAADALVIAESVLRDRRTTVSRLRRRCRRGLAGSAAVRRALDELSGTSLDAAVRRLREALEARGVLGLEPELHFVSAEGASAYGDLVDEQGRTLVEVDGYLSHTERVVSGRTGGATAGCTASTPW